MSTVVIPSDRYAAIAGIIARLHNSGLSAKNVMLIMAETIGDDGDAQYADLATWSTSQILSAAAKLGIKIIPARLERVMGAVRFITPTTPLCPCKKCALFTITNERGAWEVVLPGHACPFCNEYIEPNAVETKHVSWITGRDVELSQEFDRSGAEPIPLTQQGIFDFVARRRKTIDEFIVTVVNRVLEGVPNPYLRFLNVLACHPKHSASFTRGPLQIISALYSPDACDLIENEIKDIAFLAKQQWWVKGGALQSITPVASAVRGPVKVVLLYAQEDRKNIEKFFTIFRVYAQQKNIEYFDGGAAVLEGARGRLRMEEEIVSADCAVVFLSSHYLANPIYPLAAWQPEGTSKIGIAIYLRPCMMQDAVSDSFAILPSVKKPVSSHSNKDAIWVDIVRQIAEKLKTLSAS